MKRWVAACVALMAACGGKSDRDPAQSEPGPEPAPANAPGCLANADCAVAAPCCGPCGALAAEDAVPLRRDEVRAFRDSCASGSAGQLPCSTCFRESNPYLVPVCERGICGVLDLMKEPVTECEDGGCTLRANVCCADEAATFISVSASALPELDAILCDGAPPPLDCRIEPPMHQGAVCREQRCSSAFFDP